MQASVCAAQGEFPPARRKVQLTTAVARALRRDRRVCYAQETLPGCSAVGETPQNCCAGRPSHRSTAWSTQRLISGQQQQRQSCWTTDEVRVASPLRCSTAGSGRSTAAGADGTCCCSTCTRPAQGAEAAAVAAQGRAHTTRCQQGQWRRRQRRGANSLCLLLPYPWPAEIGVGLTGLGFLFLIVGVLFFFDRGLLAMGNVRREEAQRLRGHNLPPLPPLGCTAPQQLIAALAHTLPSPPPPAADPVPDGSGPDDRAPGSAALLCAPQKLQGLCFFPGRRPAGGVGLDIRRCAARLGAAVEWYHVECGMEAPAGAPQQRAQRAQLALLPMPCHCLCTRLMCTATG